VSTVRNTVLSPSADRDLVLCAVLGGISAVAAAIVAVLMGAAAATSWLAGQSAPFPPARTWLPRAVRLLTDPAHPGDAFGPPWAEALDGRATLYWTITGAMLVVTLASVGADTGRTRQPNGDPRRTVPRCRAPHRDLDPALAHPGPAPRRARQRAGRTATPRPRWPDVGAVREPDRHARTHPVRRTRCGHFGDLGVGDPRTGVRIVHGAWVAHRGPLIGTDGLDGPRDGLVFDHDQGERARGYKPKLTQRLR
jgi:hypothetical protein